MDSEFLLIVWDEIKTPTGSFPYVPWNNSEVRKNMQANFNDLYMPTVSDP